MLFQKAFSLVELIISVSMISILFGLVVVNLLKVKETASLNTAVSTLITDLKNQQLKAMTGNNETGESIKDYGLYFENDSYTLFQGIYSQGNPSNFTISLGENIRLSSISFPSQQVVFKNLSGEISGASGSNTIVIEDSQTQEQKTTTLNKYGVIVGVD